MNRVWSTETCSVTCPKWSRGEILRVRVSVVQPKLRIRPLTAARFRPVLQEPVLEKSQSMAASKEAKLKARPPGRFSALAQVR